MPFSLLDEVLSRAVSDGQVGLIRTFADWLTTEGTAAGGIGPHEAGRLWDRHILDSAAFSIYWPTPPDTCLDLGSGAGLPGIVLAILWPDTEMQLVDRSGRRAGLMRRAIRILGLENVNVLERDVYELDGEREAIVMRAALPPPAAAALCSDLLAPRGTAVVGLSRLEAPGSIKELEVAAGEGTVTRVETVKVLDPPAWMLIMSKS